MRSRRHRFRPGLDRCEGRLLLSTSPTGTTTTGSGSTGHESSPIGPPPVGNSSATANPLLYALTKAYGSTVGQSNYNPAVDLNHDGVVGRKDAYLAIKEVTPNAPRGPLYLTLSLAAGEQANTPHPANSGGVTRDPSFATIVGHTFPNSLVFTDDTNNDFLFSNNSPPIAVNAQGWFTDTVEISGPYRIGQHNFLVITPSLQTIRRAFPILQLVKPVKPPSGTWSSSTGSSASGSGGTTAGM